MSTREDAIRAGIRASWIGSDVANLPDLVDAPESRPSRVVVADWNDLPSRPTDCARAETRHETWAGHSDAVARRIAERWSREGEASLAAAGLSSRYGLSFDAIGSAFRACALLHDLGKLQQRWQSWAARYQRDREPTWVVSEPLAHTDGDPAHLDDRERGDRIRGRGPHAIASAWYGRAILRPLLASIPYELQLPVASACAAAIVARHGSWLPDSGAALDVAPLAPDWLAWVQQVTGLRPTNAQLWQLNSDRDPRGTLASLLDLTTSEATFDEWLPLVAYLTRSLRLADQRAAATPSIGYTVGGGQPLKLEA